jgi:hypothetical protein
MLRRIIGSYQGPERLFLFYASFARLGNFESDKSEQEIISAPPRAQGHLQVGMLGVASLRDRCR